MKERKARKMQGEVHDGHDHGSPSLWRVEVHPCDDRMVFPPHQLEKGPLFCASQKGDKLKHVALHNLEDEEKDSVATGNNSKYLAQQRIC